MRHKKSIDLAWVLSGGFTVLVVGYLFLGIKQKPNNNQLVTTPKTIVAVATIKPTIVVSPTPTWAPEPTPEIFSAQKDILFKTAVVGYQVLIPVGAKYQIFGGDGVVVKMSNGLTVSICTNCQPFILGCAGLLDGNPSEGGCNDYEEEIGEGIKMGGYFWDNEPTKIMGYREITQFKGSNKNGEFGIFVRVYTDNFRKLSAEDKLKLLPILKSLK